MTAFNFELLPTGLNKNTKKRMTIHGSVVQIISFDGKKSPLSCHIYRCAVTETFDFAKSGAPTVYTRSKLLLKEYLSITITRAAKKRSSLILN